MKKKLIDFVKWLAEKRINPVIWHEETLVDQYLKSINSVPEDKAPALVPNEGKEKVCRQTKGGTCPRSMGFIYKCEQCAKFY